MRCLMNEMMLDTKDRKLLEPSTGVVVVFWNLRQGGGCRDSYKMGLSDTPPNIIIILYNVLYGIIIL